MAKYTRHDPRNKKRNKHKTATKQGKDKRIHKVGKNNSPELYLEMS